MIMPDVTFAEFSAFKISALTQAINFVQFQGAFTPDANDANKSQRNSRHLRVKFTTQQTRIRVMGGASARQLQSRCKMYSCFCKSTK